ncbi:MAG: hypothetical protein HY565_04585 [Candidatus Kerfeldbacteria bacterium]|nr:hypothetical protein [Candidatus Kerfeldbacteria bacterium]
MSYRYILVGVISLLALLPHASRADSITLDGVSPTEDENITPPDNQKASEENFYTFWLKGQIGTQYEANFTVSEEPAFTFVSGGDMTLEDNVHYNPDNSTFTVTYTAVALQQIDSQSSLELDENQTLTIIAISFPAAEGENGPGAATIGSWLATNFQEWTLTTPSESNNAMGATVQGDAGDTGDFELFMPDSALNLMAEYDGEEEYSAEDMAVYKDDAQAQAEVEAVTGGAYVSFSTTLPEESNVSEDEEPQALHPLAQGVSQALTVAPIPPLTLNVSDESVEKYDYVKLTGTIKSGKSGKTVTLWRRFKDGQFEKFATVTTTKNGKFKLRLKIRRNIIFKAKYKDDVSDSVSVQVN